MNTKRPIGQGAKGNRSDAGPEQAICGLAAVRARFQGNAGSIRRLYFDFPTGKRIGVMCKALAQARKVYRCVEPAALEKIAGTVHHGGIVAVVAAEPLGPPTPAEVAAWARRKVSVLVLDRIGNPHNLGAIARTAAFLGVPVLVLAGDPGSARPSDAAYRVAEGGLEHLTLRVAADLATVLKELAAAGYEVVGAATTGGKALRRDRRREAGPVALVLGNEEHGLSPAVAQACTRLVTIPGSGRLESLNVSVAAAILIWELLARPA